jgi:Ca2+-binding RTX toxin-like protein
MRSVAEQPSANRLELNDDGTPKRRYEQEEGEESRIVLRSTIGLVLANVFLLVKNVMFGDEPANAATSQGDAREQVQKMAQTDELPAEQPEEQGDGNGEPVEEETDADIGSSTTFGLLTSSAINVEPDLAPIRFRGSSHIASSNDNESLYGAKPGRAIGLNGDSIALTAPSGGGGGNGGGGHGGGSSGGETTGPDGNSPDPDDDEDDDDDHGTNPNTPEPPRQVNRLPIVLAPVVLSSLLANEARALSPADFLAHASDPDGDTLTIRDLKASSGTLLQNQNGGWTFTPDEGDTSGVTFTYKISDGKDAVLQTASLDLLPPPVPAVTTGTSGHDEMIGTPGNDILDGLAGNDLIYGREGDDVIYGGEGNDRLIGGDGNDVIFGGAGDDVIFGNAGDDVIDAGTGNDFADGGEGDDKIKGGEGQDTLLGGAGNDYVSGGEDDDTVHGDAGNDVLDGDAGNDSIDGGDGNDVARGGTGNDTVALGAANDTAIAEVNDGDDAYDGGEGTDTYDTSSTTADAVVDLVAGTAISSETGNDTIENFENVNSGSGNDSITGNDAANCVNAGAGHDAVDLGAGNDTAVAQAGDGNDTYEGGAGSDSYDASSTTADTTIDLGAETASSSDIGSDTISGFENVATGSGDDTIAGTDEANCVDAGAGADNVNLGGGDDTVVASAGDGDDIYDGGGGEDTYDMSTTTADALIDLISLTVTSVDVGSDVILNFENVKGGKGDDRIIASDARNVLIGGEGDDRFEFHSSAAMGNGRGYRDQILDFDIGDRIDIDKVRDEFADSMEESLEDKNIETFMILSNPDTPFTRPGELRIKYDTLDGRDVTILQGNTDYQDDIDFELELAGTYVLTDNDFYRA